MKPPRDIPVKAAEDLSDLETTPTRRSKRTNTLMSAITSAQTGLWTNPATWTGGVVPGASIPISYMVDNGAGTHLIRVTTVTAHPYVTNDKVYIQGVVGTTEANGYWVVTAINANTFDLAANVVGGAASVLVNAYISGGTAVRGDAAIIASGHVVTVADGTSASVGPSGPTGTAAVTIQGSGKLVIGTTTGATLVCRGDLILGQTSTSRTAGFYALTLNAGSILEFDASQATTPLSQTYVIGATQNTSIDSRTLVNGTALAHAVIRSNAGGGNARFSQRGFSGYLTSVDATYCDFLRIGDATNYAFDLSCDIFSLQNCTLTACGAVHYGGNLGSGAIFRLLDTQFTSSLGSYCVLHFTYTNPIGAGVRDVKRCAFDKPYGDSASSTDVLDFSFQHCVFEAGYTFTDRPWAMFDQCVNRKPVSVDTVAPGSITNTYWLCDFPTYNPHFMQLSANNALTINGVILEYTGSQGDGDGIGLATANPVSLLRHTIKNCIVLPRSGDGAQASCTLSTHSGPVNQAWAEISHCTLMGSPAAEHGIQLNETTHQGPGTLPLYRSNLYWDTVARANHLNTIPNGVPTNDTVTASGCTNNCAYNALATPGGTPFEASGGYGTAIGTFYKSPMTSGTPGAGDVNVNPNFVDVTRNFAGWAATQGQAASTTNTLALLRQNLAVNIPAMRNWVQAGFAPQNAALKGAAHDGTDIGAVPVVAATPFVFQPQVGSSFFSTIFG